MLVNSLAGMADSEICGCLPRGTSTLLARFWCAYVAGLLERKTRKIEFLTRVSGGELA